MGCCVLTSVIGKLFCSRKRHITYGDRCKRQKAGAASWDKTASTEPLPSQVNIE